MPKPDPVVIDLFSHLQMRARCCSEISQQKHPDKLPLQTRWLWLLGWTITNAPIVNRFVSMTSGWHATLFPSEHTLKTSVHCQWMHFERIRTTCREPNRLVHFSNRWILVRTKILSLQPGCGGPRLKLLPSVSQQLSKLLGWLTSYVPLIKMSTPASTL